MKYAPTSQVSSTKFERSRVEDFLFYEAQLLDAWKLEEWRDLFTEDARYIVPSTDNPDGDVEMDLALIDDDIVGLRGRIQRLMSTWAHIENPRSTTTRTINNVRLWDDESGDLGVRCSIVVYRSRLAGTTSYVADVHYGLRPDGDSFKIAYKHAVLGHHTLREVGGVLSIIL
ncbi:aromatic-ring-hydroxylating dioxygenase subunit beta [Rhodococcus sp. ZPP]|uniref:aromatic-ring-hydroxylating dioxygenase subunit beta n=1 Tax=Rhodococcus sp. ZPP TaxID=2749906 RepID=UPI001AD85A19|nr:aromatic-ring-hydroxylating dioxygenase subunit beta [Rhodococcus sp. ZPP]QTJ67336.1 aromatic-ring-hydroxylating dioxygenase subunit beta [Rhodococcus sp. ZPP]